MSNIINVNNLLIQNVPLLYTNSQTDNTDVADISLNNDICIICYESLNNCNNTNNNNTNNNMAFSIPECGHTFHQSCINSWFRQGNSKCPLCNDTGVSINVNNRHNHWESWWDKYITLKRISKKKNAPDLLKKEIDKLDKREKRLKNLKNEFTNWKKQIITINDETMTINDLCKTYDKKRNYQRSRAWALNKAKRSAVYRMNIIPVILPEKKKI